MAHLIKLLAILYVPVLLCCVDELAPNANPSPKEAAATFSPPCCGCCCCCWSCPPKNPNPPPNPPPLPVGTYTVTMGGI